MAEIVPTNGVSSPIRPMPGVGGTSNGNVPVNTAPTPGTVLQPGQGVQANPFAPTTGTGVPGTAPVTGGLPPGTQQTNNVNWTDGSNTIVGDFKDTYGAGTGIAITDVLKNLGTSNDAAVQATIANTNLEAGKQYANIQATQAAQGITPDSSSASLAAGDFFSSVNTGLQSTIANMENQQQQTLLEALLSEGSAHGPDESGFQKFADITSGILGLVGGGSQVASGAVSAINPGADTSILDALGALAI